MIAKEKSRGNAVKSITVSIVVRQRGVEKNSILGVIFINKTLTGLVKSSTMPS